MLALYYSGLILIKLDFAVAGRPTAHRQSFAYFVSWELKLLPFALNIWTFKYLIILVCTLISISGDFFLPKKRFEYVANREA